MAKLSLEETRELKVLVSQIKALCDTIQEILNDSNTMEMGRYTSFRIMAQTYNDFHERARSLLRVPTMLYTFKTENMRGAGDTLWSEQKTILEQTLLYSKMLLSSLEGSMDFADDEFDNLNDFISLRLRSAVFSLPEKEVDIQNAIESLLLGRGLSIAIHFITRTLKSFLILFSFIEEKRTKRGTPLTSWVFRTLRSAGQGFAPTPHELFAKSSIKNYCRTKCD